jgi:hypothetical protein
MLLASAHCIPVFGLARAEGFALGPFAIPKSAVYNLASSTQQDLSPWSASSKPVQKHLFQPTLLQQTAIRETKSLNINA